MSIHYTDFRLFLNFPDHALLLKTCTIDDYSYLRIALSILLKIKSSR